MQEYNPDKYWIQRGKDESNFRISDQEQHDKEVNAFKGILLKFNEENPIVDVCEIGPGSGRFTKLFFEIVCLQNSYTCYELSPDRLDRLKKMMGELQFIKNIKQTFLNKDFITAVDSNQYSIIFASHVLLHIPPVRIKLAIQWMIDHVEKGGIIINIDYFEDSKEPSRKLAPHNFLYDYQKLFKEISKEKVVNSERILIDDWVSAFVHKIS